jgi:hypothetical protein
MVSMSLVVAAAALGMNKSAVEAGGTTKWAMGSGRWWEKIAGEVWMMNLKERPLWDL